MQHVTYLLTRESNLLHCIEIWKWPYTVAPHPTWWSFTTCVKLGAFNSCQRCFSKVLSRLYLCSSVHFSLLVFNQLAKLQANFFHFVEFSLQNLNVWKKKVHFGIRWTNVEQVKWCEFFRCTVQTSVSNNDCMNVCSPVSGLERLKTRKMPWDFTPCRSPINETESIPRATSPSGTAGAYWPCWRLPAALRSSPVWLSGNSFINADVQIGCCVCWDVVWLRCLTRLQIKGPHMVFLISQTS